MKHFSNWYLHKSVTYSLRFSISWWDNWLVLVCVQMNEREAWLQAFSILFYFLITHLKWRCKFQQARTDKRINLLPPLYQKFTKKACITGLQNTLLWSNKPSIFSHIQPQNGNAIDNPVSPSSPSNFNNSIQYFKENTQLNPLQPPFSCLFACITDDIKVKTLEPQGNPPASCSQSSHRTNLGHNFQDSDMLVHKRFTLCQYIGVFA